MDEEFDFVIDYENMFNQNEFEEKLITELEKLTKNGKELRFKKLKQKIKRTLKLMSKSTTAIKKIRINKIKRKFLEQKKKYSKSSKGKD